MSGRRLVQCMAETSKAGLASSYAKNQRECQISWKQPKKWTPKYKWTPKLSLTGNKTINRHFSHFSRFAGDVSWIELDGLEPSQKMDIYEDIHERDTVKTSYTPPMKFCWIWEGDKNLDKYSQQFKDTSCNPVEYVQPTRHDD